MNYTIEFEKKDYDYLMDVIKTGHVEDGIEDCGFVNIGAVNCELMIRENCGKGDRFYGENGVGLDANFYLLGKDTDYAETESGIPYSHEDGFYVEVKDTYEDTLEQLLKEIEEYINSNKDLLTGSKNTELTWDYGYQGNLN